MKLIPRQDDFSMVFPLFDFEYLGSLGLPSPQNPLEASQGINLFGTPPNIWCTVRNIDRWIRTDKRLSFKKRKSAK
jgi:hypothetical protein